jgi:hypothetical protein
LASEPHFLGNPWQKSLEAAGYAPCPLTSHTERPGEILVPRQSVQHPIASIDDDLVGLVAAKQTVQAARREDHELGRQPDADSAQLGAADDVGGGSPSSGRRSETRELFQRVQHVVIAIGEPRIAAIVAADGQRRMMREIVRRDLY